MASIRNHTPTHVKIEHSVARGGTQGGLNCPTHALPRRLPTPTEEADGGGGTVDRAE